MIEVSTVVIAILCGLAYRYMVNMAQQMYPDAAVGPQDHSSMPETKFIQPLEAREYDAAVFVARPGTENQVGAFGQQAMYI